MLPQTEAETLRTALAPTTWALRGQRNRAFVLATGEGHLDIGDTTLAIPAPGILWLPASRSARLTLSAGTRGAALTVSELALGRAVPSGPVGRQVREALFHPVVGARLTPAAARDLIGLAEAVGAELRGGLPGAQEAARHHLVLFLISLWRISSPQPMRVQSAPRAIVRNFLHLVELHLSDHWSVGDYAQFLSVSRARLTSAVKRVTGRTPLQLIHERLLSEAGNVAVGVQSAGLGDRRHARFQGCGLFQPLLQARDRATAGRRAPRRTAQGPTDRHFRRVAVRLPHAFAGTQDTTFFRQRSEKLDLEWRRPGTRNSRSRRNSSTPLVPLAATLTK